MSNQNPDAPPDDRQDADQDESRDESRDEGQADFEPPEEDIPSDGEAFDGTPVDQIQKERAERLDPENRPDNAEVDNTDRELDIEKGMFTDEPGYEEAPKRFPSAEDQGA
jgi:hypothetical protein